MKVILLLLGMLVNMGINLMAQRITPTVTATAGHYQKTGSASLEWTMGEFMVETLKGPSYTITQGFHQTNLTVVSTQNPSIVGLSVYPNPFTDQLILQNGSQQVIQMHLMGADGKCIGSMSLQPGTQSWTLDQIPSGTYFLEAEEGKQRQVFILEKLH